MATVVKTIGTVGRDYATVASWEAAIDNTTYPDPNTEAKGECYNDSAFNVTATTTIDAAPSNVTAITLSVASGQRHDGTAGTGARMVATAAFSEMLKATTGVETSIEWLEFNANENASAGATSASGLVILDSGVNAMLEGRVAHCIVHDNKSSTSGVKIGLKLESAGSTSGKVFAIIDNIVYDIGRTTGTGSAEVWGLADNVGSNKVAGDNFYIANNTVYNTFSPSNSAGVTIGLAHASEIDGLHVKNNLVVSTTNTGTGGAVDYDSFTNTTNVSHNLSSDATAPGTNSLTNKTAANQFIDTTGGSENLHLKTGADAIDAGVDLVTTPAGVNIDIDGRDRDAQGDVWDMGADEFVAAGGQTIPVGQAVETNTAGSITALKTKSVGQALETDSSLAINRNKLKAIGIASELDTAFSLTWSKLVTMGLATETDSALGITASRTIVVGLASEADTAHALTFSKQKELGLAVETDIAFSISTGIVVNLGQAIETDTAQALVWTKLVSLGQAVETDSALALASSKQRSLGLATSQESALPLTAVRQVPLGQASEADTAFAMSKAKLVALGLAIETDTALTITVAGGITIGIILFEEEGIGHPQFASEQILHPLFDEEQLELAAFDSETLKV